MDLAVVDLSSPSAAFELDGACRHAGFFLLANAIDRPLLDRLDAASRATFALPTPAKAHMSMAAAGAEWRGWFPLGGELTSGRPDLKEGLYFGSDGEPDGRLMHGRNRWPADAPELRRAVEQWMIAMESLGQQVLAKLEDGLGVGREFFARGLTCDPTSLFRVFRYPPQPASTDLWGVGEHTDYGLLTLLAHDGRPGLEVRVGDDWIPVPADPDLIVCNLGDMLDRLTGGRYRSTPHRVRNHTEGDRLSFPFFLDPGWDAVVEPIDLDDGWLVPDDSWRRWDRANLRAVSGTYGDWLTAKVTKVFPSLAPG